MTIEVVTKMLEYLQFLILIVAFSVMLVRGIKT